MRKPNLNDVIAAEDGRPPADVDPEALARFKGRAADLGRQALLAMYAHVEREIEAGSLAGDVLVVAGVVEVGKEQALAAARRMGRRLKLLRHGEDELLSALYLAKAGLGSVVVDAHADQALDADARKEISAAVVEHLLPRKKKERLWPTNPTTGEHLPREDTRSLAAFETFELAHTLDRIRANATLTETEQEVVRLHYGEEMRYAEIADVIGSTKDSCKTLASRARKELTRAARELGILRLD